MPPGPRATAKASPEAYAAAMADPAMRGRYEAVLVTLIGDYEWYMSYGTESQRFHLIKTALPDLMRAHRAEEEQSRDAEMRAAYMRLREAFGKHIADNAPEGAAPTPGAPLPTIDTDAVA